MSGGATGAGGSTSAYSGAPMIGGPSAPLIPYTAQGSSQTPQRMGIGQSGTLNGSPQGQAATGQPQYGTRATNYGWAPSPASASFNQPTYPQLYGGQWNQLAQMMAGPSYGAAQPINGIAPAAQQNPGAAAALPQNSSALAQLLSRNAAGTGYGVGGYMTGGNK